MDAVTICSDSGAPKIKSATVSPSIWHEVMGLDALILVFWMWSFKFKLKSRKFKPTFHSPLSLSSRGSLVLFAFFRKSGVICISEVIDISPGHPHSSLCFMQLTFHMVYSAYELNKQGDNIQPWHTPFPIWNQSVVPCPVLTVASWPAYRFLRRQVRWSGIPISLRIFQFMVIYTSQRLWHCQ